MNPQDQCPEIPRGPALKKSRRLDTDRLDTGGVEIAGLERNPDPNCQLVVQEAGNEGSLAEMSSDGIDDNQMAGFF